MCSPQFVNKIRNERERAREREIEGEREAHFMDGMSQVGIPIAAEEVC